MIELRAVSFRYRKDWILHEITFQVTSAAFVGVIGPNGSGKTTLLKLIGRLLSPQRGEVRFRGTPLETMDPREIAKRIAVVPQETYFLFPFRVLEVVLTGRSPHLGHRLFESPKDLEIAQKAMAWTETLSLAERPIDELSGGEKKRVLIARALAQEPDLILLDEPTANLDIHHQVDFLRLILTLNREQGVTVVMASHDMNIASEFCDQLILLHRGNVFRTGVPNEVVTQDHLRQVYGCDVWVDEHPFSGSPRVSLLKKPT